MSDTENRDKAADGGLLQPRIVRLRKTPRDRGTTNCHSCGKEIPQSALCAECWHKRFMKSRETNVQSVPPADEKTPPKPQDV
jgi:DNA-directed RNA polymerase subunit RPC12/RpoP